MLLTTDFGELTGESGNTIPVMTIVYLNVGVLVLPFIQVMVEMVMLQYRTRALKRKLHSAKGVQGDSGNAGRDPQQDIFVKHPEKEMSIKEMRLPDDKDDVRLRMAPSLLQNQERADAEWRADPPADLPDASIMIIPPG
jgi:hypothetical protein